MSEGKKEIELFAQVVIGPPGSGKTSYCKEMYEYMKKKGRKVFVVNLDPANDNVPYDCAFNIDELIVVEEVMELQNLGPNGGLVYAMEFLNTNFEWMADHLLNLEPRSFVIFDMPGQMELYAFKSTIRILLEKLNKLGIKIVVVNLVDSLYCTEVGLFISVVTSSLAAMMQLEMPHINVLSKYDLLKDSKLKFEKEYYREVLDLNYLVSCLDNDPLTKRFKKLNQALADIIESYSLVSFLPLDIQREQTMLKLLVSTDRCVGFLDTN